MAQQRLGGNLVLASVLALLSYVPFDLVAKGSLIVCAILFILDPIPPVTRLVSLVSLLVVHFLSKLYKQHHHGNEITIEQNTTSQEQTTTSQDTNDEKKDDEKKD
jgi:xanthosine utilization system XapX-like protein